MIVVLDDTLTDPLAATTPSLRSNGTPRLLLLFMDMSPNPVVAAVSPPIAVLTSTDP